VRLGKRVFAFYNQLANENPFFEQGK